MVEDFVQHGLRDLIDGGQGRLLLFRRHISEQLSMPFDFIATDFLDSVAELHDRRDNVARLHARAESADFEIHNLLGPTRLLEALLHVGINDLLQVVDIVNESIVDIVDRGIDVPRNRDIDEKYRLVAPAVDHLFRQRTRDDEMRRSRRGDDDICPSM